LPNDAGERFAVWAGEKQEVETHVLALLAKLILHGAACGWVTGIGCEQLHAVLESGILADDFEESAVL
jgi:hypothetical protein